MIDIESELIHLSDEKAQFLLSEWDTLHPSGATTDSNITNYFERDFHKIMEGRAQESEVMENIAGELSPEEFVDAKTIFYLARDGVFPEFYESQLEKKKAEFEARGDFRQEIYDLMGKTNFRRCFVDGLKSVGRVKLSRRLAD